MLFVQFFDTLLRMTTFFVNATTSFKLIDFSQNIENSQQLFHLNI